MIEPTLIQNQSVTVVIQDWAYDVTRAGVATLVLKYDKTSQLDTPTLIRDGAGRWQIVSRKTPTNQPAKFIENEAIIAGLEEAWRGLQ